MNLVLYVVIATVIVALIFDAINGLHDAANSIATVVSTRVLPPRFAVLWAAFFNFVALFVFSPKVADTVSKIVKIRPDDNNFVYVVLAGLIGAILWDLLTWAWGMPVSSSHALIGGLLGSGLAYEGISVIHWRKIILTVEFIPLAPLIGFAIGLLIMLTLIWIVKKQAPLQIDKLFRKCQLFSAALYSLGHGGNDAQKTMGIIVALLLASGYLTKEDKLSFSNPKTLWILLSCNLAMAIGTAFGGWRIVKTMGQKITKLKPVGGFSAELSGSITLFMATYLGVPVSTTHTITGSIVGVGSVSQISGVKWGVAKRIVWAWLITIPFAAIVSALCFKFIKFILVQVNI